MLEMVKEWLQSYIRSHGVRAVVSMVISGLLYLFVNESAIIYVEQTLPLIIGACIFAAIALLSLVALYFRDGMDFLLIVGAVLCVIVLVNCIGLYAELDALEQPVPSTYTGSLYFTGSYCRNCDNGKCRDCGGDGIYDHEQGGRLVRWRCTRCDGDGECNLCNGTGRRY